MSWLQIGNKRVQLSMVVATVLLLWIRFGHTLCSCCQMNPFSWLRFQWSRVSGMSTMAGDSGAGGTGVLSTSMTAMPGMSAAAAPAASGPGSSSRVEAFTVGANNGALDASHLGSATGSFTLMDPSKWAGPDLTFSAGNMGPDVRKFYDRKGANKPLPPGQMDVFADTAFKPECCPSSYSNDLGCACLSENNWVYLRSRGGNNAGMDII